MKWPNSAAFGKCGHWWQIFQKSTIMYLKLNTFFLQSDEDSPCTNIKLHCHCITYLISWCLEDTRVHVPCLWQNRVKSMYPFYKSKVKPLPCNPMWALCGNILHPTLWLSYDCTWFLKVTGMNEWLLYIGCPNSCADGCSLLVSLNLVFGEANSKSKKKT